jgi:predicted lipoprotein with Yx(FWY)xxD motif
MITSSTPTATRLSKIGLALLLPALVATACSGSASGPGSSAPAGGVPAQASTPATGGSATRLEVTGGHLTDATGRTVYMWVSDTNGKSACSGQCATVWPAVPAAGTPSAGSGVSQAELTRAARSDGKTQLVYAGHPLYYFTGDTASGDAKGQGSDGFGAKWWELTGAGQPITAAATGGSAPASTPKSSPKSSSASPGGGYGY